MRDAHADLRWLSSGAPVCLAYLFETPPPEDLPAPLRKRFQQAPHPYVFEVPLAYRGEALFELGLILVGRALDYLPYLLYIIQEQGQAGLGRAPYRLVTVMDGNRADEAVIYRAGEGIIGDTVQGKTIAEARHGEDAQITHLAMEFLTPLRIKKFGDYQARGERFTFATLLDLLLGRLEALAFFHCDEAWRPDTMLREAARHIHIEASTLRFQSLERYSNRRHQKLPLHGLLGTLHVRGSLEAFLPVLRLGEDVHLGAGTAFGLGKYRLHGLS
jgi:hypothetical protein